MAINLGPLMSRNRENLIMVQEQLKTLDVLYKALPHFNISVLQTDAIRDRVVSLQMKLYSIVKDLKVIIFDEENK